MITYLEQMQSCAAKYGVSLKEACRAEGVADTTLMRWLKSEASPREETARGVMKRIERMAGNRPAKRKRSAA